MEATGLISAQASQGRRPGRLDGVRAFFTIIRHNHRAFAGLLILVFFVLMAVVGPRVIRLDNTARYSQRLQAPSWTHPLGTDYAGRDTLAQFVHGANAAITLSIITAVFTVGIAQALVRGIDLRCGCFGTAEPASWETVFRDVVLVAIAGAVVWLGPGRFALERSGSQATAEAA